MENSKIIKAIEKLSKKQYGFCSGVIYVNKKIKASFCEKEVTFYSIQVKYKNVNANFCADNVMYCFNSKYTEPKTMGAEYGGYEYRIMPMTDEVIGFILKEIKNQS